MMLHERYGFTAQHVEYGPGLNAECFRDDAEARDCALLDAAAAYIRALAKSTRSRIEMGRFFAAPCGNAHRRGRRQVQPRRELRHMRRRHAPGQV